MAQYELISSQPWRCLPADCSRSKCAHKLRYMFIPKLSLFEVKSIEFIVSHSSLVNLKGVLGMMILLLVSPIKPIFGFISTPCSDMLVDDASIILLNCFMFNILVNSSYPDLIRSLQMLCSNLAVIPIHYEIKQSRVNSFNKN